MRTNVSLTLTVLCQPGFPASGASPMASQTKAQPRGHLPGRTLSPGPQEHQSRDFVSSLLFLLEGRFSREVSSCRGCPT